MKLYYKSPASSLAVRIIINELSLSCDYEYVDLVPKNINPKGRVPVLVANNGDLLTETSVILEYLADETHNDQLLPKPGDFKRYQVLEWLSFVAMELHRFILQLSNPNLSQDAKDKEFIPSIKKKFSYIDDHLKNDKEYLVGNMFTLPDAYLFVMIRMLAEIKFELTPWPQILRYFNHLQKRASIQKSLQDMGGR